MSDRKVAVVMGSDSDWAAMRACVEQLHALEVGCTVEVMSAHRSPERVQEFARAAEQDGHGVIIAAAGMAAHLAGALAAHTTLPVIGVPIAGGSLNGLDALLSTVQMPPGVPVATVAIGEPGARNAAILAAQVLALADSALAARLKRFKADLAASVTRRNDTLQQQRREAASGG